MVAFGQDNKVAPSAKSSVSSEKDLRKLRRIDLLELLIEQIRENDHQAQTVAELGAIVDDLKARLDEADARIGLLLQREVEHERHIETLKKRNAALAHAAGLLDADEILKIADIAVDIYMGRASEASSDPSTTVPMTPIGGDAPIEGRDEL